MFLALIRKLFNPKTKTYRRPSKATPRKGASRLMIEYATSGSDGILATATIETWTRTGWGSGICP